MKLAVIQQNPTVGDLIGNAALAREAYAAHRRSCDLVIFPETFLCGYPPEDLLFRPAFIEGLDRQAKELATITEEAALLIGSVRRAGDALYNCAYLMRRGKIEGVFDKRRLPNYGVFDERRYFTKGRRAQSFELRGARVGVRICEDIWDEGQNASDPVDVLVALNASPYEKGKRAKRLAAAAQAAALRNAPLVYCNMIGGQDELAFDGASFVVSPDGALCAAAPAWQERTLIYDGAAQEVSYEDDATDASVLAAITTGLRDYVRKNGFSRALIGMSGGVDSAAVAAVATLALGKENVRCVSLPSQYNGQEGRDDAREAAKRLGVAFVETPIESSVQTVTEAFTASFGEAPQGLAAENLQSRIRGAMLMTLSNHSGELLLTTGNKSEMAVGYATLYGDMCGAFNPIKDLYKTEVYSLCRYINAVALPGRLPENILTKAPSAELRFDQKDADSLPPYDVLDRMLFELIEGGASVQEVVAKGFNAHDVKRIAKLLKNSEYKRRQAPPGVKVSALSFGRERRYPLSSGHCFD